MPCDALVAVGLPSSSWWVALKGRALGVRARLVEVGALGVAFGRRCLQMVLDEAAALSVATSSATSSATSATGKVEPPLLAWLTAALAAAFLSLAFVAARAPLSATPPSEEASGSASGLNSGEAHDSGANPPSESGSPLVAHVADCRLAIRGAVGQRTDLGPETDAAYERVSMLALAHCAADGAADGATAEDEILTEAVEGGILGEIAPAVLFDLHVRMHSRAQPGERAAPPPRGGLLELPRPPVPHRTEPCERAHLQAVAEPRSTRKKKVSEHVKTPPPRRSHRNATRRTTAAR